MFKPDDVDRKLIEELRRDSRTPATVLARRLKIPRVTIQYRLRRLRQSGLIHRFTVLVDRKMDGKELTAFTLIHVSPGYRDIRRLAAAITRIPGVVEVHDVTGSADFVVKIHAGHVREIGQMVNRIRVIPGVSGTETLTSVNTYKEEP
jgi:Lrp/AsnC family transcriptional regulator, leucine-responsive regulatory protein